MSGCTMSICGSGHYDGHPEFSSTVERKARKRHVCLECRGFIEPGQKYTRNSGKFDGDIYDDKICNPCMEIREAFQDPSGDPTEWGMLWDYMTDNFRDLTTGCFARLQTPEAKALLRARWMKWKGIA